MTDPDGSLSFYFFDVDDNLLFLPTNLFLWTAECKIEQAISSAEFAAIQNDLGRKGKWQPWGMREETFRDFRDRPGVPVDGQAFIRDLHAAITGDKPWQGPSWPLLVHAAEKLALAHDVGMPPLHPQPNQSLRQQVERLPLRRSSPH